MPSADDLPVDLRPLTRRQAIPLTARHWAKDKMLLVDHLKRVPGLADALIDSPASEIAAGAVAMGKSSIAPSPVRNRRSVLLGFGAAFIVVLGVYSMFARDRPASAGKARADPPEVTQGDKASAGDRAGSPNAPPSTKALTRDCDVCPELVGIPAGSFTMGANDVSDREQPRHPVTISQPLAAGRHEITFDEWDACVRARACVHNPGDDGWGRGRRPVINVSWNDARQYTKWLSAMTGKHYRLLSEAEWEYLARSGITTPLDKPEVINANQAGDTSVMLLTGDDLSRYKRQTMPVGSFRPNAFGLHDMHSNAWEWTEDCWNANYYGAPDHGGAWTTGNCGRHVIRGGTWTYRRGLRSADRGQAPADMRSGLVGFRVARAWREP